MGQFTEVDTIVSFETSEQAKKGKEDLLNIVEEIKKKGDIDVSDIDIDGDDLYFKNHSGRYQNAEWGANQIFELMELKCEGIVRYTSDINTPTNIIYFDRE